jgi:hypothetical protein
MAKAEDRQLAECKKVEEYENSKGEKRLSYQMELDGKEFSVPQSKYFSAVVGRFYCPMVVIVDVARVSKRTGNAYIASVPNVVWNEVK